MKQLKQTIILAATMIFLGMVGFTWAGKFLTATRSQQTPRLDH